MRENISYKIFNKFKPVFLYKSVEVHISVNTFMEIANGASKKNIKSSSKKYLMWTYLKFWPLKNSYRVYNVTKNNSCSQLFSKFIQSQKRYLTSLDKSSVPPWRSIVESSQAFCSELNTSRIYSLQNISYLSLLF